MRIVLLGGFGYLGKRLAAELRSRGGIDVIIAERRVTPSRPEPPPDLMVVEMDWRDQGSVKSALRKMGRVDGIVHLAFPDTRSLRDAEAESEKREVRSGMSQLFELVEDTGCRVFFHVSTAKVYGKVLPQHVDESTSVHPGDLYAELHRTAEEALAEWSPGHSCGSVSFRLSNSFGFPVEKSTSRWDLIVNGMCRSAVVEHSIPLGSGAESYRDFVPLGYAVGVLARELEVRAARRATEAGWTPINLGAGRSMTLESMARRVQERARLLLGRDVPITRNPGPPGGATPDPAAEVVFRSLYLEPLGNAEFEKLATLELDTTLRRCVDWFA